MSQNNNNELAIGIGFMAVVAFAIMIAGIFIALIAVASFVFSQWRHILRYEGSTPVWWLAGITAVIALPSASNAAEQLQAMSYYLDRNNDQWVGALFGAIVSIVMIAAPTAAYWVYRLIKPISHFRIGTIEHFHDQYRNGDLTRTERNAYIKETIEMGDEALEQRIAHARRKPAPPITMVEPSPTPAPRANTSMAPANQNHPRDAFDIPPQRVDG